MDARTSAADGPEAVRCPYCGTASRRSIAGARCAVCGMEIGREHVPHIVLVRPGLDAVHFCSLSCMGNRESLGDGGDDA